MQHVAYTYIGPKASLGQKGKERKQHVGPDAAQKLVNGSVHSYPVDIMAFSNPNVTVFFLRWRSSFT